MPPTVVKLLPASSDPLDLAPMAGQHPSAPLLLPGPAPNGRSGYPPGEELRTLLVSGFPPDVKDRELQNLLRFLPGYTASRMDWVDPGHPRGLALFESTALALAASAAVNGTVFDDSRECAFPVVLGIRGRVP